jgi:hypothetical protein
MRAQPFYISSISIAFLIYYGLAHAQVKSVPSELGSLGGGISSGTFSSGGLNNNLNLGGSSLSGPSLGGSSLTGPSLGGSSLTGHPLGGSSGTGPGSPSGSSALSGAFVVSVCTNGSDFSNDCWSDGGSKAAEKLAIVYLRMALGKVIDNSVTLRFPDSMTRYNQIRMLQKLESRVIRTVLSELRNGVSSLTPFNWKVEDNRQIEDWAAQADRRATDGTNWTHNWDLSSHTFRTGTSFQQLQHINMHGWSGF